MDICIASTPTCMGSPADGVVSSESRYCPPFVRSNVPVDDSTGGIGSGLC